MRRLSHWSSTFEPLAGPEFPAQLSQVDQIEDLGDQLLGGERVEVETRDKLCVRQPSVSRALSQ